MKFRLLTAVLALVCASGCFPEKKEKTKRPPDKTKDVSGDTTFMSFAGRLRTAVDRKDRVMLAQLMAPDFGWRWDNPPAGEDPFVYWDQHGGWAELSNLMRTQWVPYEGFMVVPPQFAAQGENYGGYRAGVRLVNGSWRLQYFVPAPPPEAPAPAAPAPTSL